MQLEEGGKETSTNIFSSSTDLNLLRLTVKPHLCYARNKNSQMNQTVQKRKADLDTWFWVFKEDKQIQILLNQKHQMAQRHIWVCFQSRTSNNTLHLDAVSTLTPDLQAVLIIMGVYPLICVWQRVHLYKFLPIRLKENLSGLFGCAWRAFGKPLEDRQYYTCAIA